ncbi:MAG TPA: DNA polymerase III subunit delta' [Anaerolineae bacterium]|nr:DNA polymerase III subunit delta' [Anaerolineae bacterium]
MSLTSWPIFGHHWAVDLLDRGLRAGRLPHALLLAGPAQVGKRTLALALAAALNCSAEERPCGQCRSCRLIAQGGHPDVRLVSADDSERGRDGVLKIDQIRELQRAASLAPMEARYKIFVLRELERANLPAANALLKTLEEPPAQVVLLLTSARPHALLPTIISRCQVLTLRGMPQQQVADALVSRWGAGREQADLLARLAEGRLGWAVQRLTDDNAWNERTRRMAEARDLPRQNRVRRLAYADELSRSPAALQPTLALWASWWRDVLLVQQGCGAFVRNVDLAAELAHEAAGYEPAHVQRYLARLQAAPTQINQNVNARLLLETLVLHMPAPRLGAS